MNIFSEYHQDIINQKLENIRNSIQCSFEFFPPKNSVLEENLWFSVKRLSTLKPKFFSVTYGANTGEREKTYDIVRKIQKKTGIVTAAHLTCIDSTSHQLEEIAKHYWKNGIKSIIALRGDTLKKNYKHTMYALDLVVLLKKIADFDISVAAYPELHPESKNSELDIINLKKKLMLGQTGQLPNFFLMLKVICVFEKIVLKIESMLKLYQVFCLFVIFSNYNVLQV